MLCDRSVLSSGCRLEWHLHCHVIITAAHRSSDCIPHPSPGLGGILSPALELEPLERKGGSALLNLTAAGSCFSPLELTLSLALLTGSFLSNS